VSVAAIDPPLFAGLYMFPMRMVARFGVLHHAQQTGHPEIDRVYVMKMHDLPRVRSMFYTFGIGDLLAERGHQFDLVIKDRTVELVDVDDDAVPKELAQAISRFTDVMEPNAAEINARARWNDLAIQLGLSFDPRRWHLYGKFDGIDVSVAIEGSPPAVSTSFRARWRLPLACGVKMRRGFRESVGFATWKDGAAPGFPELDKIAVIEADDLERARQVLLGDPAVRSTIAGIAAESNFTIDDREVVLGRGGFAGRTEIRQRLEELRFLVDKVSPPHNAGAGPFR